MAHRYRAYLNGQGYSVHDSKMPKGTWENLRRKFNKDRPTPLSIADLKNVGWKVKRVEIADRHTHQQVKQVRHETTRRHHIGWLILFVVLGILILGLGIATILG